MTMRSAGFASAARRISRCARPNTATSSISTHVRDSSASVEIFHAGSPMSLEITHSLVNCRTVSARMSTPSREMPCRRSRKPSARDMSFRMRATRRSSRSLRSHRHESRAFDRGVARQSRRCVTIAMLRAKPTALRPASLQLGRPARAPRPSRGSCLYRARSR